MRNLRQREIIPYWRQLYLVFEFWLCPCVTVFRQTTLVTHRRASRHITTLETLLKGGDQTRWGRVVPGPHLWELSKVIPRVDPLSPVHVTDAEVGRNFCNNLLPPSVCLWAPLSSRALRPEVLLSGVWEMMCWAGKSTQMGVRKSGFH